jgi:hypothetical protein
VRERSERAERESVRKRSERERERRERGEREREREEGGKEDLIFIIIYLFIYFLCRLSQECLESQFIHRDWTRTETV